MLEAELPHTTHAPRPPKVSIITPAFNAAPYLPDTLASLKAQTYENWEWVVADDGSTDDTVTLLMKAARTDPRIRVLTADGKTGHPAAARNRALVASRGEVLAFLDADDTWKPDKLSRQVRYLLENPSADGVCCHYEVFGDPTRAARLNRLRNFAYDRRVKREEMLRGCPWQTSTFLFHRRCYELLGGMDEEAPKWGEDLEYFSRVLDQFEIHRIPVPLTGYRVTPIGDSLSTATLDDTANRGWPIYEILVRKGVYRAEEARKRRARLHYEEAKDNLFHRHTAFRRPLLQSIQTGAAPLEARIMIALAWLPAFLLRPLLVSLLAAQQRWKRRSAPTDPPSPDELPDNPLH
jgi:glycosyltransferase involved in cell wall biosynthesis